MITQRPTAQQLDTWKTLWEQYRPQLRPNRKTGAELLAYLQARYTMNEVFDAEALDVITGNVTENKFLSEKLPHGAVPVPRAFYLENCGTGQKFYAEQNRDDAECWGGVIERIFVGVDLASGFYYVEGSTMLWDELCAVQGLDENDLDNFVMTAQYIEALRRFDLPIPVTE